MKKILYLSHVRWGWIKQRPHFLAEGLAKNNKVDYCFYQSRSHSKKNDYTSNNVERGLNLSFITFFLLPFERIPIIGKCKLFERLNWLFMRMQLPSFKNYDIVWITHPTLYPQIKCALGKNNRLVYDCMDDMVAFPEVKNDPKKVNSILKAERELIEKSSAVFCSSEYLKNIILNRAFVEREVSVINNAIELPSNNNVSLEDMPKEVRDKYDKLSSLTDIFMYIGTISEWFDFEKIERLTREIPTLNVVLIGPAYAATIPQNPQIHVLGPMDRKFIFAFMDRATALIMPFVLNDLIESVNPVKLYEYIFSGKPSIATFYSESEKFKEFVCLYHNYDELKQMSLGIIEGNIVPKPDSEVKNFIRQNTWEERFKSIEEKLK